MATTVTSYTIVPMLFDGLMLLAVGLIGRAILRDPQCVWRWLAKFWRMVGE